MSASDPALARLAADLEAAARASDTERLREYLHGRHLPAMGGDLTPAEILELAIRQSPELARLLSPALARLLEHIKTPGEAETLHNALQLVAILPPDEEIFESLCAFEAPENLELPLLQALVYQQTDERRVWMWLLMLEMEGAQTPSWRTRLFTAWRGLLWAPPGRRAPGKAPVIDFDRVERGLVALHNTLCRHEDTERWLGYTLEILIETFPRSVAFWKSHFAPRYADWPPLLQKAALRHWPGLDWESRAAGLASA